MNGINCKTPSSFISLMICLNPWRILNVIHPTFRNYVDAVANEPMVLTELQIDENLKRRILSAVREEKNIFEMNYNDYNDFN